MSQIRAITVNDVQYNVAQASAVEQKKLMLLLGAKIAFNSAAGNVDKIDVNFLVGSMLSLPEATFDEIATIVLRKAFVAGETIPIDTKSFQGGMLGYFRLVAEAVAFNLDDFFTWLDSENAARRVTVNGPKG